MTINVYAKPSGTQGALQLNGVDAVVYDSTGIVSGVNKSAVSQQATLGTAQATTSGTALDFFTGIPSWVKTITVMLSGVSTNNAGLLQLQIGSGSVDVTGYLSAAGHVISGSTGAANSTTGLLLEAQTQAATSVRHGVATLIHMGANLWAMSDTIALSNSAEVMMGAGTRQLAGVLDRIRLTTTTADTFDAGSWNILYE